MANVKDLVLGATIDEDGKKKLECGKAHELAKENDITLKEIGKFCNENSIKIKACELGCF